MPRTFIAASFVFKPSLNSLGFGPCRRNDHNHSGSDNRKNKPRQAERIISIDKTSYCTRRAVKPTSANDVYRLSRFSSRLSRALLLAAESGGRSAFNTGVNLISPCEPLRQRCDNKMNICHWLSVGGIYAHFNLPLTV
jgi:hypothetical protein